MAILALVLCLASGYLLIATAWPGQKPSDSELLMRLSLSTGFGLGIFSVVFFVVRLLGLTHLIVVDTAVLLLLLVAYSLRRSRTTLTPAPEHEDFGPPPWVRRTLTASFLIAVLAGLYNAILRAVVHHPHGDGWDAFSIWNLHARFLFLGADHWRDGFNPLIPWSHPDYPLFLPAAIAHFWSYLGHDDPAVPAIISLTFTFSTLTLLFSSVALLRGPTSAMLAGLALASTPFFIEQGTSQYADVTLSFFVLASIVLLHLGSHHPLNDQQTRSGPLILAGLAAGFAAWTKNEGLLFLSAFVVAQVWGFTRASSRGVLSGWPSNNLRSLVRFPLGAAPMLLLIAWFKHSVATAGDLVSSPAMMIHKAFTPSRYWIILQWYAKEFLRFGNWWIVPGTMALVAFYLLTPRRKNSTREPVVCASRMALALTLAGYFAVYLITPKDLYWHLRFSLSRLFLQLWPSTIFLFFLIVSCRSSQIESNSTPKNESAVKKFATSP
jgi:hypothetical protein